MVDTAIEILKRRRNARVVQIDQASHVFPAARGTGTLLRPTKHLSRLKRNSGVLTFVPHGIRHTLKARLTRAGVEPYFSEQVLGHALRGMEVLAAA